MAETSKAVFLSYASQDAAAASAICDALRAAGVEVWFDRNELRGGDAWDAAIRRQIRSCTLLMPVISAHTQQRDEGYFRLEWKLAVDRSHLISHDRPFLVPVVVDDIDEGDERVPDRFREIQWTRLPGGKTTPAFCAHIVQLLESAVGGAPAASPSTAAPRRAAAAKHPPPAVRPRRRGRPPWAALALVALVIAIGVGAWGTRERWMQHDAVVAYSHDDRRMTFAVLPFQSAAGDAHAAQIARATADEIVAMFEERKELVSVVPRGAAEQAAAHETGMKRLANALDVHFLVRGRVTRAAEGYHLAVLGVDGDTERLLTTQDLPVTGDELTPHWRDDVRSVVVALMTEGLLTEAKRARARPVEALDVRDLTFRATADWLAGRESDGRAANVQANALLQKALAIAPDDLYALRVTAWVNLCDCVNEWSDDPEKQKAIGAAAMERYLKADPTSLFMLIEKATLFQLRLRWEESVVVTESILSREPTNTDALDLKAIGLLHLGRLAEAKVIADGLLARNPDDWGALARAADIDFALGDYAQAAQLARRAVAQMSESELRDRAAGTVRLTLVAAEAHLQRADRAKAALDDFTAAFPKVTTVSAMRKWIHPTADLAGFQPFFDGLHLAGVAPGS